MHFIPYAVMELSIPLLKNVSMGDPYSLIQVNRASKHPNVPTSVPSRTSGSLDVVWLTIPLNQDSVVNCVMEAAAQESHGGPPLLTMV